MLNNDPRALNNGRRYDCGRVPPLPKQKGRSTDSNRWMRRIKRGQILVDGIIIKDPDYILSKAKQHVEYHRYPWKEPMVRVQVDSEDSNSNLNNDGRTLKILYADDHLLVVHKPSGLPTMPSQTFFEYSILNALRRIYNMESDPLTNVVCSPMTKEWIQSHCSMEPQPVHRLGVGTSGVLVVAASQLGRQTLTDAIRHKSHNNANTVMRKVYRALVYACRCDGRPWNTNENAATECRTGPMIPDSFTIDCPIGLVPFPIGGDSIHAACPRDMNVLYDHIHDNNDNIGTEDEGISTGKPKRTTKPALSHVKVVCRKEIDNEEMAVVEVEIPTGRPHQIRIHMAYAGYPLVGDPLYLPGGIPNTVPRTFEAVENEEEDMDTDDETEESSQKDEPSKLTEKMKRFVQRVPLPRDCGYFLHAHSITLEHPCKSIDGDRSTVMTFTATPPPILQD